MDRLTLLQRIFPTQESNWGLLLCRPILYQLNYQGSPIGINPILKSTCDAALGSATLAGTFSNQIPSKCRDLTCHITGPQGANFLVNILSLNVLPGHRIMPETQLLLSTSTPRLYLLPLLPFPVQPKGNHSNYSQTFLFFFFFMGFPGGSEVKVSASDAGDPSSFPGSGRSPGEGNGNPLQYSCLENPTKGEAW